MSKNLLISKDVKMTIYNNSKSRICNVICFFVVLLTPNYSFAQKLESVHKDWTVLTTVINSNKVCYIASLPTLKEGNVKERKDTYILINQFPERKPEISFSPGFALQEAKSVKIDIEGSEYLLTKINENIAWTQTATEDDAVVAAMKKGMELTIRSEGQESSYAIDTYSLKGFTAAIEEMTKLCTEEEKSPVAEAPAEGETQTAPAEDTKKK